MTYQRQVSTFDKSTQGLHLPSVDEATAEVRTEFHSAWDGTPFPVTGLKKSASTLPLPFPGPEDATRPNSVGSSAS